MAYNNSVLHSQTNHCLSDTKTNRAVLFRKIIVVYSDKYTKHVTVPCIKNTVWIIPSSVMWRRVVSEKFINNLIHDIAGTVYHLVIYMQSNKIHKLDIVGTVYHLVIYMQSNKIHKLDIVGTVYHLVSFSVRHLNSAVVPTVRSFSATAL